MRPLGLAVCGAVLLLSPPLRADDGGCALACVDDDDDGFLDCACAPPGAACDCDDADPRAFPLAPEACDSPKDLDCDGRTREGCDGGYGCLAGLCVPECVPLDDFGCAPRSRFDRTGDLCLCAPEDCRVFGCPPGQTCDDDARCIDDCQAGVRCPFGLRCRGTGCIDPCAGVVCALGGVCAGGVCVPSCDCPAAPCGTGETCIGDAGSGSCIATDCATVTCPSGTHCETGSCIDDCANVTCPTKEVCRIVEGRGACVDLCTPNPCKVGFVCDWRTGACTPYAPGDGGLHAYGPGAPEGTGLRVVGGGASCSAGVSDAPALGGIAAATLGALVSLWSVRAHARRRRRER